jgi:uncharacterized protein (TIGR03435 family)
MRMFLPLLPILAASAVHAQAPAFEVTSVKVNTLPPRERHTEFGCSPAGRFVALGMDLRNTFFWAFNMRPFQVTGLPGWIDAPDAVFDIEAKAAGPVEESQCRLMVQTLLADRFKLRVRRENRELPAYGLVVTKSGPKMHKVSPDDKPKPGGGVRMFGNPVQMPPGRDPLRGWSMTQLADRLTGQPALDGRPVLDRTGLDGTYEIDLNYAFVPGVVDAGKPEIFDAVQDQLGLKLDSIKASFETLIIDRLERPDAN